MRKAVFDSDQRATAVVSVQVSASTGRDGEWDGVKRDHPPLAADLAIAVGTLQVIACAPGYDASSSSRQAAYRQSRKRCDEAEEI
jgi:hypothetical protein